MPASLIYSFVTFLVILDPVGVAVIFAAMTDNTPAAARRGIAWRGILIAGILILVFAAGGQQLLDALGISMRAFRLAGGVLLFLLATDMVFARDSGIRKPTIPEQVETEHRQDISVFPLAFPLLAGPGALTSVVLLIGRAHGPIEVAGVIASLLAALALTFAALLLARHVMRVLGVTGANVIGRVLGVVLAALAAQYVLDGLGLGGGALVGG